MDDRRSFYRNCRTIKFAKGEIIFLQNQVPKCVYSIISGVVEESNSTSSGDYRSISFEIVGDILPKCCAFSKTNTTLFIYTAYTDCEMYVIDKEVFKAQLANDINFANKMLSRSTSSLLGARLKIDALEKPNATLRLLYMFRYLCLAYGKKSTDGFIKIQVPLTQQRLADFAGFTRETATLLLHKMKTQKIISSSEKYFYINIAEHDASLSVSMLPFAPENAAFQRNIM